MTDSGKKEIREACIYLVSGEPLSALMKHVRSVIQRSGMAEQLIRVQSEQYILKFLLKPEMREQVFGIFVLERFSGSIYEELRKRSKENNKCRIVSPLTIIQAAKQDSVNDMSTELRIPFKPYPLLSMAMSRLSGITLSGDLAPDERKDLSRMIALMGGSLHSNGPNTRTSVVVGRKMCDTRCVMARQMDPPLPIVSPDWIHHCYAESEKGNIIDGREKYRKYQLTPFAGFKLSPAQVSVKLFVYSHYLTHPCRTDQQG